MKKVIHFLKDCLFLLVGIAAVTVLLVFVVVSLPVYIYRWIVCKVLAPCFRPRIGKAVTSFGVAFGTDYASKEFVKRHSRSTLVTTLIFDGTLSFEKLFEVIQEKWIKEKSGGDCALCYPELQQYVESWMGFLFWKQDEKFDLRNHMKLHQLGESATEGEAEEYVSQVIDDLLNKPFLPGRSTWEGHVIQGYHNEDLRKTTSAFHGSCNDSGRTTVVVFRVHHGLADGFSIVFAIIEDILGTPLSTVLSIPSDNPFKQNQSAFNRILSCVLFPLRLCYDVGGAVANAHKPQMNSPWHIPDAERKWRNLYGRSGLIPIEKVSLIKNRFGVSFTSVLFSCMGAALAKNLEGREMTDKVKCFREAVKYIPVTAVLPLPNPRKKMRNHLTNTLVDLPISYRLGLKERLVQSQRSYVRAKKKTIPYFLPLLVKAVGSHLAVVANMLLYNRVIPGGLSNVPGPKVPIVYEGSTLLTAGFAFGDYHGVAGVGFQIISYAGFLTFSATVEKGVMSPEELTQLLLFACQELDDLYELALLRDGPATARKMPDIVIS